ncbi:MAG: tetratricopeptide repeat protein [Holophagaceae bacterium]|nr:tetratricopeptide repeat protein [Holophagaceae bacterium]
MKYTWILPAIIIFSPAYPQENNSQQSVAPMNDEDIFAFAKKLMENAKATQDELRAGIKTLQDYKFKNGDAPEREYVLFAQGILEDRTGQLPRAITTFRRFERTYPQSHYMPEVHYAFGRHALNQKSYKDAETRFAKVIESDMPAESKFNAQGLLVWCLVDQKKINEAITIVQALFPIDKSKPDERALVAIMEVQCEMKALEAARRTRSSYVSAFRNGSMKTRVNFAWGMLLDHYQQSVESARALREVIRDDPRSAEADEARLTLATIIADGRLPERSNPTKDTPDSLIAQIRTGGISGDIQQRALLLQLRVAVNEKQAEKILSLTDTYRRQYPDSPEMDSVLSERKNAVRTALHDVIDSNGPFSAMSMLTAENIGYLTPELRTSLVSFFVSKGLPEAATKVIDASPEKEKNALRQALTKNISEPLPPPKLLASLSENLLDNKGELGQIQILLSEKKWGEASDKIERLSHGANRIKAILALLTRPMPTPQIQSRIKEAEGWLAKCKENNSQKEPLLILIADLYMQIDNPKAALDLYPTKPLPENLGWVSLMRASAMGKLGQKEAAKRILNDNASVPEFQTFRQALSIQLNR